MPWVTRAALCILIFAALLSVRLIFLFEQEHSQTLGRYLQKTVLVRGSVSDDPDVRENAVRVNVLVDTIDDTPARGVLLAVLPANTPAAYGDRIIVRGKIQAPETFTTDTGRVFDYPNYLRVRGISALMQGARLEGREESFTVRGALFSVKHAFNASIERIMPVRDAALLEGILLGERRGLPEPLTQAFIISSLIHVVVLSGYNISIVAEAVLRGLRFLPRSLSYSGAVLLMVLFIIMTGGGSTALRAGLMALIAVVARYLRRPAAAMRGLIIAGALLILWNPLVALYDPSFILSILATFGLIALSPWVEARLPKFLNRSVQLRSIAASTIAVQAFLLPALLYYSGVLSLVALPANLLVLPTVPFAMLMGFLAALLGFVGYFFALVPALLCDLALRWAMVVAETSANLPLSHVTIPAFPAWVAVAIYIPFTAAVLRIYSRTPTN